MTPKKKAKPREEMTVEDVVAELGIYPIDAFEFVQEGLTWTCQKIHGPAKRAADETSQSRHVTGQQLSEGLLEFAVRLWGLMAPTVLAKWSIHGTIDFGRIVFAMVDAGIWNKTDDDTLDDFLNVYDFKKAFAQEYKMTSQL